jgi:hypothetical protein
MVKWAHVRLLLSFSTFVFIGYSLRDSDFDLVQAQLLHHLGIANMPVSYAALFDVDPTRSADLQSRCDYVVKIPTRFSVNLGVAGALVMYDRLLTLGRHAPRPVAEGAPTEAAPLPVFGEPIYKRKHRARAKLQSKQ